MLFLDLQWFFLKKSTHLSGQDLAAHDRSQGIKTEADKGELDGQQDDGQIPIRPVPQKPKISVTLEQCQCDDCSRSKKRREAEEELQD